MPPSTRRHVPPRRPSAVDPAAAPGSSRSSPWDDPVVDRRGHDPRSAYVEQFWLSVLGPTATWLLRRLVAGFDHHPDGYELDVGRRRPRRSGSASPRAWRHRSPRRCSAASCSGSSTACPSAGSCAGGCRPISQRHLLRLPAGAAAGPRAVDATTIHLDALERAHALARAMVAAGDDRGVLEPQLVAVGVPARPPPRPASRLMARFARWVGQGRPDQSSSLRSGAEASGTSVHSQPVTERGGS